MLKRIVCAFLERLQPRKKDTKPAFIYREPHCVQQTLPLDFQ